MNTFFISDLHLWNDTPHITDKFFQFTEQLTTSDTLYILGDFFCYWVGDDYRDSYTDQIKARLKKLTDNGTQIYFMHGNRDFTIGEAFVRDTGMQLLPDPYFMTLHGKRYLLTHGDAHCLDDINYLRLRKVLRHPLTLWLLPYVPLRWRLKFALMLRGKEHEQLYADSHQQTIKSVEQLFMNHEIDVVLHGHTHTPQQRLLRYGENFKQLIVLSDWGRHGHFLRVDEEGSELRFF